MRSRKVVTKRTSFILGIAQIAWEGGGLLAQIDFETYLKMIMMLASKWSERQKTKFEKWFLKVGRGVCVYRALKSKQQPWKRNVHGRKSTCSVCYSLCNSVLSIPSAPEQDPTLYSTTRRVYEYTENIYVLSCDRKYLAFNQPWHQCVLDGILILIVLVDCPTQLMNMTQQGNLILSYIQPK